MRLGCRVSRRDAEDDCRCTPGPRVPWDDVRMAKDVPADDPRLYDLHQLYSALRITCALYDSQTNQTVSVKVATAFVIDERGDGSDLWLISNRHVLDPPFDSDSSPYWRVGTIKVEGRAIARARDVHINFDVFDPKPVFHPDGVVDVAMVKLDQDDAEGLRTIAYSLRELVSRSEVLDDELGVGTEFVMPGYPSFAGVAANAPILVPGLVSSDLRFDAEYGPDVYPGEGLCHAFSRGGMSGAPLLASVVRYRGFDRSEPETRLKVVGVNRGHVDEPPYGMSTLSLFIPSWRLLELFASNGNDLASVLVKLGDVRQQDFDGWQTDQDGEDD